MTPPERHGFTLIEVLIAITITTALAAVAATAYIQIRQAAQRNRVLTDLAQEAAYIFRRMDADLGSLMPTGQLRLERLRGATPDRNRLRVFFLADLPDNQADYGLYRPHFDRFQATMPYRSSLVCRGWEWRPPGGADISRIGTLLMGATPWTTDARAVTRSAGGQSNTYCSVPSHRRSAARSPDDNDLRLLPGADAARTAMGLGATQQIVIGDYTEIFGEDRNGDGTLQPSEDLYKNGRLDPGAIAPVSLRVKALDLAWLPYGSTSGDRAAITAADGVTDPGGQFVAGSDLAVFDGLYRDARQDWASAPAWPSGNTQPVSVLARRPAALGVRLVLADPVTRIERTFTFTFPLANEGARSAGL